MWTWIHIMRTNIVIDDTLMAETLEATGLKTKREAVELGLQTLLRLRRQPGKATSTPRGLTGDPRRFQRLDRLFPGCFDASD
jgi:Arc/MetJ family transcription regulator